MSSAFQNLVVSYLPRNSSCAFIQRFFNLTDASVVLGKHAYKCVSLTTEPCGSDDFRSLVLHTCRSLHTSQAVNCFDFVLVLGDTVPGPQEAYVLVSLKQNGVACFGIHVSSRNLVDHYRSMLDVFCGYFSTAYAPLKMITMAPWHVEGKLWVVPVFRMDV